MPSTVCSSTADCIAWRRRSFPSAQRRARQAVLTHHHEDHSGNAQALQDQQVRVSASAATCERLVRGFGILPYQRLLWGQAPRGCAFTALPAEARSSPAASLCRAGSPGHCDDQIALYEPRTDGCLPATRSLAST